MREWVKVHYGLSEGVPLPKATTPKQMGDYRGIPAGAKYTDQEIAYLLSFNLVIAMTYGMRIVPMWDLPAMKQLVGKGLSQPRGILRLAKQMKQPHV